MTLCINDPNGYLLAESHVLTVNGLPGIGSFTLVLSLDFTISQPKHDTCLKYLAIRVDWGDSCQRMIGMAIPDMAQPVHINPNMNKLPLSFRLSLTPSQIEAIEVHRNGGDLNLSIWMTGEICQNQKSSSIQQMFTFKISQQQWIEALEKMEYRNTLLFEVSVPDFSDQSKLLLSIFRKAQYHLLRGNYDECVAECRKLLEAYSVSVKDDALLKDARNKYKGSELERNSMSIAERLAVLKEVLKHSMHVSHHPNPGDGYSRDQARAILGMVMALIGSLIRLPGIELT